MSDSTAVKTGVWDHLKSTLGSVGFPTIIIAFFWVLTLFGGYFVGISVNSLLTDTLKRAGMNAILVLAMVPAIQSGTGPNFALPIGIECGLLAMVCAIEMNLTGLPWLVTSLVLCIPLAILAGYGYGKLLNAVKGSEMTIATYTGFSVTALMAIAWLAAPFSNPKMLWMMGTGLRETIQLDAVEAAQIINNFLMFTIGGENGLIAFGVENAVGGVTFPTGLFLVFAVLGTFVWLFFRSKTGIAISAAGINPKFAVAAGLNIDSGRIWANVLSTILGAIGIIIYSQSFGYAQLYTAPLLMAFPAVAAVLVGGASASRANVLNVVIGVFLLQGLFTTSLPVANELFRGTDLSEIMRMVVQNGIILYALTQVKKGA